MQKWLGKFFGGEKGGRITSDSTAARSPNADVRAAAAARAPRAPVGSDRSRPPRSVASDVGSSPAAAPASGSRRAAAAHSQHRRTAAPFAAVGSAR